MEVFGGLSIDFRGFYEGLLIDFKRFFKQDYIWILEGFY
jgi:hypothetical protein